MHGIGTDQDNVIGLMKYWITQREARESNKQEEDSDCESFLATPSCPAKEEQIRQSRPDSGLGLSHFQGEFS